MNLCAVLGVYASVLKERGEPLYYPGDGLALGEGSDSEIIAKACEWALHEPKAKNQAYNVLNGELSTLKEEWGFVAKAFGMEAGPVKTFSFVKELPGFSKEWDAIRGKYGLQAPNLDKLLGQSAQFCEYVFRRSNVAPSAMSGIKIRRAGFNETIYMDEMITKWIKKYQEEELFPPA